MMKNLYLAVLSLFAIPVLFGAVKTSVLPQDAKNNNYWLMENEHIKAVFSSRGGTLYSLQDKRTGKFLLDKEAAFRDQFGTRNNAFSKVEYRGKFTGSGTNGILEFKAPAGVKGNIFTLVSKRYILRSGESKLHVEVTITNQIESMQDRIYAYWSNNFFGIAGIPNYIYLPMEHGILKEISGSNLFHKQLIRGWLAIIGGKSGVVLLPEYKKLDLMFSWNCLGASKRNTFEFRNISESVAPGKSTVIRFSAGILRNFDRINGAGNEGYGKLSLKNGKLTAELQGFSRFKGKAVLKVDGRKIASMPVSLNADKPVTLNFPGTVKGKAAIVEITGNKGKVLFDLYMPLSKDAKFLPREKRNTPPKDKDPWQYDPDLSVVTPHYKWLNNKKFKILFLTEATGARDIVELHQRMNFDFKAPTLFPSGWTRAWRTKVPFAPASGGESGVDLLAPYLKSNYDVIVIGDGRTRIRVNRKYRLVSSWSAYPENIRKTILAKVRKGTGLLLINTNDADPELTKLLKSLKSAPGFLRRSMSYGAAPYFPKAKVAAGTYGKGRVISVTFRSSAFIAPLLKRRQQYFQKLSQKHRFQEYQFAIISRMINYLRGENPAIISLQYKNGKAEISCTVPGKYEFELFNAYSQPYGKFTRTLKKGVQQIALPGLQNGNNYLHVRLPGKDFAFLGIKYTAAETIKAVNMKNSFKQNEPVSGTVELSPQGASMVPELEIFDNLGRLLWKGKGKSFKWDHRNAVVNRHILRVTLRKNGSVTDMMEQEFFLPEVFDLRKNYSNLIWVGADMYPEYLYTYHFEQLRRYGFNFLYGGSFGDGAPILLRHANVEVGMNWHAGGARGYHLSNAVIQKSLAKWYKTGKKEHIVRVPCYSDPKFNVKMVPRSKLFAPFYSRYLFQLGDEMSLGHFQHPVDYCFCVHCMKSFRKELQNSGMTLKKLNALWKTSFKSWDEVMPQTFNETLTQPNAASFVAHRLFMDKVFARSLARISDSVRKEFPDALVGPTGVVNTPHTYGGNWNFWNMSKFDCVSTYGRARVPVSFNREKRFTMSYFGYDSPEGNLRYNLWEGLFIGERNSNHWYSPIFLLPDLAFSKVRTYYSRLLWDLRNGPGDLLYHAKKHNTHAGILLSQRSIIANFLKQVKVGIVPKLFSFAKVFEDLGVGYRFVAQEELTPALLKQFKVLVLCESSALSDKEIAMIREFVRKGGKVIADYDIALQDEHCISRKAPALNQLFGISSGRQVLRKVESHNLKGITINNAVTGIRCKGGKAAGMAVTRRGKAPLAITNGNTLYLNFEPVYDTSRESGFRDLIGKFINQPVPARYDSAEPVLHGYYTNGRTAHIALLPHPKFAGWQESTVETAAKHTVKGKLTLQKNAFLYDSIRGKYLGYGKKFDLTTAQGLPTLLSALPYKVSGVKITAPAVVKRGTVANISAAVRIAGKGKAENHVLIFQVFRPDGSEALEFRTNRLAPGGKFTFKFAPALNEKGSWRMTVKDAASGMTAEHRTTVK